MCVCVCVCVEQVCDVCVCVCVEQVCDDVCVYVCRVCGAST